MLINTNIAIVEARFYEDISDMLVTGTEHVLNKYNITFEKFIVPGILEIPITLQMLIESESKSFDGAIVLGCAIKGETDHYEHVCTESIRGTQDVALAYSFPVGNAILTCPRKDLAINRADPKHKNFGGKAAAACIELIKIKRNLNEH